MKLFLGQLNPTIGALSENRERIRRTYADGVAKGADIVVVPELSVTGYPPRDLLDKRFFIDENLRIRDELVRMTGEVALVFGCVTRNLATVGKPFVNTAVVARNGEVLIEQGKHLLPTYDVFDELRWFEPIRESKIVELCGRKVAIFICEDFWYDEKVFDRDLYETNPVAPAIESGAELLINISASPYNAGKRRQRFEMLEGIARGYGVPLVYVNQVGGNDELIFDGSSLVLDASGRSVFCGASFEEQCTLVELGGSPCDAVDRADDVDEVARGLVMGLRDYLRKCGFDRAVVGLSGGIDSAVTAALAVEALGAANVTGLAMPTRYSSQGSVDDARALAENLGIAFHLVPIDGIFAGYLDSFREMFGAAPYGIAEENVQARIRGNLLMAWSNRTGAMVLATGNKSEMAVGYCTLYGDMSGGLAVLGDVYKTTVYEIARWLNREREVVPRSSIEKAPSAELRPDQTDQDSLPPYDLLDRILRLYIEEWLEIDEIVTKGFDRDVVASVIRMVDGNEFKRRQAAPTLRVSTKAFGSGRQMPIAQRWRVR